LAAPNPNLLVVEDTDLKGVVIGLMKHYIDWPDDKDSRPAEIIVGNSAREILKPGELSTCLKSSGVKTFGIVIDAEDNFDGHWGRIKEFCEKFFPPAPAEFPQGGLIVSNDKQRFGAWIMPDNASSGMVETFCHGLIPGEAKELWEFAATCIESAKEKGAKYKAVHVQKAHIHTWLAWQDPPGDRMGIALTREILRADVQCALAFAKWFKELYQV
jgi:hypothetical protein